MNKTEFERELIILINRYSIENDSNTPDHLLCKYIMGCLSLYASTTNERDYWYGVDRNTTIVK